MNLLDKYQKYLVSYTMPGVQPHAYHLTAEGWKLLIRENITPMIEDKLHMRQLGDYLWAGEYEDGKRKVLSFFKVGNASTGSATLKWGWNFDFVPRGWNASWARTDKSIYTHVYELSPDFYDISREHDKIKKLARDRTIMNSWYIDIKHPEKGLQDKIHRHKTVFLHLLPLITEFYRSTASYEGLLKRINDEFEDGYYRFINGEDIMISKVFMEKRMGLHEIALRDFEAIPFKNEKIRNAYFNKLNQLGEVP